MCDPTIQCRNQNTINNVKAMDVPISDQHPPPPSVPYPHIGHCHLNSDFIIALQFKNNLTSQDLFLKKIFLKFACFICL